MTSVRPRGRRSRRAATLARFDRPVTRSIDPGRWPRRQVGLVVLVAAGLGVLHPLLAALVPVMIVVFRWWRTRQRAARQAADLIDSLPDIADLLALAVAGGATPRAAVEAVAAHGYGPVAGAFADALDVIDDRGARLADRLSAVPLHLGTAVEPLVHPLVAAERYGTPLGPPLALAGRDLRQVRRHRAEEAIRRVPVKLVFPLVCCTLPAFGVLTVVPLLAASLRQIEL